MDYYEIPRGGRWRHQIDRQTFYNRARRKDAYIQDSVQSGEIVSKTIKYHTIC